MLKKEIDTILEDRSRSLIEQYLDIQQASERRFGRDAIVLMEIGSFFEMYGIDNETGTIGKPKEMAELLNLQLTRKNKSIAENSSHNPLMAGFPTAAFDRYVSRIIQEEKYTIVIVRQDGVPPNVTRAMGEVLSPGVNFDFALDHRSNYTASIIIDAHAGSYSVGYANIDVTTGRTHALEVHSTKEDPTFALDELFGALQSYPTGELLLTQTGDVGPDEILEYLELRGHKNITIAHKRLSVNFQNELFKQIYRIQSLLSPIEYVDLERTPLASESFSLLLDFIIEHDADLINNISKPERIENSTYVYLGNNPLEQLTVISDHPHERTLLQLMDRTQTSVGKRLLRERLLHPITSSTELVSRYDLAEAVRPVAEDIHAQLKNVYDVERLARRITLGRLHPFEMNFLYESLNATEGITSAITTEHPIMTTLREQWTQLAGLARDIESSFDLARTTQLSMQTVSTNIFQDGFDGELDQMVQNQKKNEEQLETIRKKIVELLEIKTTKNENEYVLVKQLDKDGHYLSMTKSRFFLVEKEIKESFVSVEGTVYALGDFTFKVQTGNVKITAPVIDELSATIVALQQKISARTKDLFLKQLERIQDSYGNSLQRLGLLLAQIDVALSTVRTADVLNLTRPEIVDTADDENFYEAIALRHPLVEANEERGIYVPNDVILGNRDYAKSEHKESLMQAMTEHDVRGVLLYGINSSGKSSLMKSVGLSIILAQSGFYVPARSFRFSIFTELFTRILSRDDLSKGLSSFAVEMMELKNIFHRCTKKSMVLGDEISHGTETISAISIMAAAILRLTDLGGLFVLATHLHQLQHVQQLDDMRHVIMVHLAVEYDKQADALTFERTLQPGHGSSVYGLEFAQSLHVDDEFLKKAAQIRKSLTNDFSALEMLTKQETSIYNKKLFLTRCALCEEAVDDTHHIKEQHTADDKGFIDHFPKDHKGNIIPLCKGCHNKVHSGEVTIDGYVMTSKGLQLRVKNEEAPLESEA